MKKEKDKHPSESSPISIARGNSVLVDHGFNLTMPIIPSLVPNYGELTDIGQYLSVRILIVVITK